VDEDRIGIYKPAIALVRRFSEIPVISLLPGLIKTELA
jgi:hypothetical protein